MHGHIGDGRIKQTQGPHTYDSKCNCNAKAHRADEVQLCAQAICLEEMFARPVPEGALFYGTTRRRVMVSFDPGLRTLTARVAAEARANIAAFNTPPPVPQPGCAACSMRDLCQPEGLAKPPGIAAWLAGQVGT